MRASRLPNRLGPWGHSWPPKTRPQALFRTPGILGGMAISSTMRAVVFGILAALVPASALAQTPAQRLGDPSEDWEPSAEAASERGAEPAAYEGDAPVDLELNDRLRALDTTW